MCFSLLDFTEGSNFWLMCCCTGRGFLNLCDKVHGRRVHGTLNGEESVKNLPRFVDSCGDRAGGLDVSKEASRRCFGLQLLEPIPKRTGHP